MISANTAWNDESPDHTIQTYFLLATGTPSHVLFHAAQGIGHTSHAEAPAIQVQSAPGIISVTITAWTSPFAYCVAIFSTIAGGSHED
jgi:hypothetical protein